MADRQAIVDLSVGYAEAVDRLDRDKRVSVFTEDALCEGPNYKYQGQDEIASMILILDQMFHYAWHAIHNVSVRIDGDTAFAETYCTARRLKRGATPEVGEVLSMTSRYQDRVVRTAAGWIDADPPAASAVLNAGMMLEHLTNGVIPTGVHRVVAAPGQSGDRYSVVQFVGPSPWTVLAPFASCITPEHPQRFGAIAAADRLEQVLWEINMLEGDEAGAG